MKLHSSLLFLVLMVFALFFTAACRKHPSATGVVSSLVKTSTSVVYGHSVTRNYTYDSLGRITVMQSSGNTVKYSYSADSVISFSYDTANGHGSLMVYASVMNASGFIIGDGRYSYSYNADGYETCAINQGDTVNYVWVNGNMVSEGSDYINDWHSVIISYIDTIDSRNFGQTFEGKKSKDLVSRRVQILSYDTLTTTYGYQFDSQGRVSEQIENPGPAQTTVYYTYY